MRALLRLLGVELLTGLVRRLPGPLAWWAGLVLLVAVNLVPVLAVLAGSAGIGDVFLVYWLENVVVWATTTVRIATAEGTGRAGVEPARLAPAGDQAATVPVLRRSPRRLGAMGTAVFFALHYGLFTLVHGVFTLVIVGLTGLTGGVGQVLVLAAAVALVHLAQLALVWFGRGERLVVSPEAAMAAPYPRMVALHLAIIGGFFFLLGGPSQDGMLAEGLGAQAGVAILCGVKTVVDVGFHLRRGRPPAAAGDGLYGVPLGVPGGVTE